ncbi:kinesin-like protein Klp5 [Gaertneriomyces sp. JEL0708]|nr:kinesin-like protein Klp5 [Gaertneriomyces sp. JEL0708]
MRSPTTRLEPGAQHSPPPQQQPGSSITVTVRIRPFIDPSSSSSTPASSASSSSGPLRILTAVSPTTLLFHPPPSRSYHTLSRRKPITYTFDRIFPEHSTQTTVYENTVQPLLSGVLDGFNATVFAYGATGCGKTYTITGTPDDPGVIFLTMQELFERVRSAEERHRGWEVRCSYFEVYNETIRDLLGPTTAMTTNGSTIATMGKSAGLELREDDAHQRVVVSGLSEHAPRTVEDVMQMLIRGNENRTRAPTEANAVSSRSHAVLQVFIRQTTGEARKSAVLSVIDLAGSERASVTKNKGERLLEGANINRSLLALGNCINALCEGAGKSGAGGGGQLASNQQQQTNVHVPYRDSKLTRLLKYSLSGNCRVVMITNVSASSVYYEETHNTLKYANRAKNIRTTVVQNVEKDGMEELRKELEVLREQLKEATTTTVTEASQGVAEDVFGILIRRMGKVYEKMVGKEQERIRFTEEVEGCERRVECMKRVMRVLSGLADANAGETGDGGSTATNATSNFPGRINTVLGQLHQTIESLHDMTTTLRHNADQMSVSLHRYTLELDKLARTRTIMRRPLSPYQIERLQMEVQMRKVEMRELALRVRCEGLDGAVKEQMGWMEEVLGECVRGICGMSGDGGLEKLVNVIVKRMGKKQEANEEVDVQWDTSTEASESEPEVESESESETEIQPNQDEEEVDELEELRLPRFTAPPPSTPPSKSKRSAEASPITVSTVKKVKNGSRGGPDGSRSVRTCRRTMRRGSTAQDDEDAVDDQPTPVPRSHRSRRDNSSHPSLLAMLGPPPVFDLANMRNTSPDADVVHSAKKTAAPAPAATPRKRRKPRQSLIPVMRKERRESMLPIPKPLPLPGSVAPMNRLRESDNAHEGRVSSPVARRMRRRGGEKAKDMTSDKENASPAVRLKSVKMERTHSGSSGGSMSPSSTSPSSGGGVLTRSAARRMGGKPKWK